MGELHKIKVGHRYRYRNQLDSTDNNLYTEFRLGELLNNKYNMSLEDYYNLIVHEDINYPHVCKNPECGKRLKFLGLHGGYQGTCNRACADRYHSYHMVEITKTGCYMGTSHFIKYNSLDSTKDLRRSQVERHKADKSSKAFGSEYQSRITNYNNILSRYNHDNSVGRYLYLLEFDDRIKIGSTVSIRHRLDQLNQPRPILVFKGKLKEIARAEMEALQHFIMDTLRDKDGKFTEYLPKNKLDEVIDWYEKLLNNSTTIEKVLNLDEEFNAEVEYTASLRW